MSENSTVEAQQAPGLEERFSVIEGILDQMEQPDVSLEQSFELYKRGIAELKAANEMLGGIEKAMLVMTENGELEEF